MLRVVGYTYEIRDSLKELGCVYNSDLKDWFAVAEKHAAAQALADAVNRPKWLEYLGTLVWGDGSFTETVWQAALRAASLQIPYAEAWQEIAGRVRAVKAVGDKWFDRNVGRAYQAVSADSGATWSAARPGAAPEAKREKPVFRNHVLERVAAGVSDIVDLPWLASRSPIDPATVSGGDILSWLYEPGERVVVFDKFESQGQWMWDAEAGFVPSSVLPAALYEKAAEPFEREGRAFDAAGQDGIWYLCNPVFGGWRWMEEVASGDEPHWSRRFHECVTSWRYMVLESDKARGRQWVAMAVQLALRISAIYTSGGKSVHVLVRLDARSKAQWDEWRDEIKELLVTLGADAGCMSAVRLTRLPGSWRACKGQPQKLLYLNPSPDMTPIASRPILRDAVGPWVRLAESLLRTDETELDEQQAVRCALTLEFYRMNELADRLKVHLRKAIGR